jgi:hypothetical protein
MPSRVTGSALRRSSPRHCPYLNGVHFVPAQVQMIGYRLLARRAKPVNGQRFE